MYTIKNGAGIYAVEKVIRVLTRSDDVLNVSASQTAAKLQSLILKAEFDVHTYQWHLTQTWVEGAPDAMFYAFLS